MKKAYDEIVEERRKREEQIERDRVRRMNRQAPENATTERLVRQKLERERNDARLELVALHAQLKGAASYHKQQHEKAADVIDKLRNENNKWREWYKPAWKSNLRRVRAESPRRPPRHRRDTCSMAWRCRFLTARRSQRGTRHTG